MGLISRLGAWLDRRFPEKVNAADVMNEFLTLRAAVNKLSDDLNSHLTRLMVLEKADRIKDGQLANLNDVKDDVAKIKAIMQLKQKQSIEMPNLTGQMAWKR